MDHHAMEMKDAGQSGTANTPSHASPHSSTPPDSPPHSLPLKADHADPPHTDKEDKDNSTPPPPEPEKVPPPASFTAYLPHPSFTLSLSLLAFVAAWVDAVSFVGFLGLFASHITGNFAVIGSTLAGIHGFGGSNLTRVLAIPTFLAASAATTVFIRAVEHYCLLPAPSGSKEGVDEEQKRQVRVHNTRRTTAATVALLVAEAVILVVSMVLAMHNAPITDSDASDVATILGGLAAVCAMGIHGATGRLLFSHLGPSTNAVTMTGIALSIDGVDVMRAVRKYAIHRHSMNDEQRKETTELSRRFFRYLSAIAFYTLGSLVSCVTFRAIQWYSMLVPIGTLLVFAVIVMAHPSILDRSRA